MARDVRIGVKSVAFFNRRLPAKFPPCGVSDRDRAAARSVASSQASVVSLRSTKVARSQSMHTHCVRYMPMARAAPRVRSSVTPRVNGPRSLITTVTDLPFSGFVTVTRDPKGSVRCAAAYPLESRHGLNCGNGDLTESDARFGSSVALCNRRPPVDVRISPLATEIAWRCNMSRRAATSRLTFLG